MGSELDRTRWRGGDLPAAASNMIDDVQRGFGDAMRRHRMHVAYSEALAEAEVAAALYDMAAGSPDNTTVQWLYSRSMKRRTKR